MPLVKSGSKAAVSENISEMVHAGHPQNQAVAAAMRNAREYGAHMASGGFTPPMGERFAARQQFHEGFLHSSVPGRTDRLPISVSGGAYVLPADHVAALGQGNSLAGANAVYKKFKMGPYGAAPMALRGTSAHQPHLNLLAKTVKSARGGQPGKSTDIIAAGGEFTIPPHKIIEHYGDLDKGHKELDRWVVRTRKKHAKTLRHLKPPKQD